MTPNIIETHVCKLSNECPHKKEDNFNMKNRVECTLMSIIEGMRYLHEKNMAGPRTIKTMKDCILKLAPQTPYSTIVDGCNDECNACKTIFDDTDLMMHIVQEIKFANDDIQNFWK